jgi:phosphonate transport system substrate-binding protein
MTVPVSRRSVLGALALSAAGCRKQVPGRDRPLVIVFGPQHTPAKAALLKGRLEAASGLSLELRTTRSNDEALDAVQNGKADAGLLPLFDFFYCAAVFEVVPLVQVIRHEQHTMSSEILVPAASPARALSDLAGQRFGYVDRASVTGFLLPAATFGAAKIHVEPVWLGSHDAVLTALAEGKVAAAASYAGHGAAVAGLRVLATSSPVANEPLFVQKQVPADVREALTRAFSAERDAEALSGLADATGFGTPAPGTWEAASATLEAAGLAVEETVKGGWLRANEHRVPSWARGP